METPRKPRKPRASRAESRTDRAAKVHARRTAAAAELERKAAENLRKAAEADAKTARIKAETEALARKCEVESWAFKLLFENDCLQRWASLMDSDDELVKLKAMCYLSDRAFGKVRQAVDMKMSGDAGNPVKVVIEGVAGAAWVRREEKADA